MDETDFRLCQLLMLDPRMQYREIADRLSVSIQAVHRRTRSLIEEGNLAGFTVDISQECLQAFRACVWGISKSQSIEKVVEPLSANDLTLEIFIGSGNFIYVIGILKNLSDLEPFVEYVKKTGMIQDVQAGIEGFGFVSGLKIMRGGTTQGEITLLDRRIINALHRDARKSITDVSEELGITIKTVRKRLSKLIDDRLIEFSLDWRTGESGGLFSMMMIELRDEASKEEVSRRMTLSNSNYFLVGTFSNLPNIIVLLVWARSIQEMGRLSDDVVNAEGVQSVMPYVLTRKYRSYNTWRDQMLVSSPSGMRKS